MHTGCCLLKIKGIGMNQITDTSDNKVTTRCEKGAVRNFQVTFHRRSLESGGLTRIFHVRPNSTLELVQIQCIQSPDVEKLERNSRNLELSGAKTLEKCQLLDSADIKNSLSMFM